MEYKNIAVHTYSNIVTLYANSDQFSI